MPVSLSIKNVPEPLLEQIRARARAHQRSLQGELLVILQEAVQPEPVRSLDAVLAEIRASGLVTPSDSVDILRRDRRRGDD